MAGWLTRECNDYPIANWLFGGSSDASAASILGSSLEQTQRRVQEIFVKYNCSFYVQRIGSHSSSMEISTFYCGERVVLGCRTPPFEPISFFNLIVFFVRLWLPSSGSRPLKFPFPSTSPTRPTSTNILFWLVANLPLAADAVSYDVLGTGTEWHKEHADGTTTSGFVTVVTSALTPTATSFIPSTGLSRPPLLSIPKVSLSNVGEALLGVGIGGPLEVSYPTSVAQPKLHHPHPHPKTSTESSNQLIVDTTESLGHRRRLSHFWRLLKPDYRNSVLNTGRSRSQSFMGTTIAAGGLAAGIAGELLLGRRDDKKELTVVSNYGNISKDDRSSSTPVSNTQSS